MSKMTKNKLAMLALAGLAAVASGPAMAGMTVESKGGLEVFETENTDYWFKVSGRLFIDDVFFDGDEDDRSGFPSGARIRAARVGFKGGVGSDWVYKLDVDLVDAPGNAGNSRFGEAFIGYNGCKDWWFAVGQVSIPFGLENWANFSEIPLMEVSLPSEAFSPDYGIGLYTEWHGTMFTAAGALYQNGAGTRQYGDVLLVQPGAGGIAGIASGTGPLGSAPGSDNVGIGGRITFSPVHDDYTVYHLGVDGRWEDFHDNSNFYQYYTGLELRTRQSPILFTNIPANSSKDHHVYAAEAAARWGSFMMQGEYMWAEVERDAMFFLAPANPGDPVNPADTDLRNPGGNLSYSGYYVLLSYVLTGETKDYDFESGTFGRVHPCSSKGAWEIIARLSYVDLLDNAALQTKAYQRFADPEADRVPTFVRANDMVGSAHSATLGLTWWVNDNVRFMANYVRTSLPNDTDLDIFGLRAQVNW